MPETKRPLKVFLSYASQDRPLVRELSRRLVGEGWIDTWVDEKSLLPGQDWRVKIEEAVEEADVVIICLSNHSVSKEGYVQKELRYAREIALEKPEETIFLIPLRLDECEVPRGLRFYQWVDYFGDAKDNSYDALAKSLKLRYEQKLKLEELEQAREEKARLEAEELTRQKVEKEKLEREAAEKTAREKNEKDAAEKARLDAEGLERQRAAKEQADREDAEKAAQEKLEKEIQRKLEKSIKKAKRDLWWGNFKIDINHRLELIRIYRVPILILLVALVIMISLSLDLANKMPELFQIFNNMPILTVSLTDQLIVPSNTGEPSVKPTNTFLPSKTLDAGFTPTATTLPTQIIDAKGITMRLVPAGEFTMGSNSGADDEKPIHQVYLDDFYMDIYEVTNAAYKACVDVGGCAPPKNIGSYTHSSYYGNSEFDNYPVIYVDWNQAKTYCEWRGGNLPTEAQWEKAARGTDGRTYPWGEEINCTRANHGLFENPDINLLRTCKSDTSNVGYYENGKSPYSLYDMAGNVWEWVDDWYANDYYLTVPNHVNNPLGPLTGQKRVVKGGSWSSTDFEMSLRSANRLEYPEDFAFYTLGFRCARSAP